MKRAAIVVVSSALAAGILGAAGPARANGRIPAPVDVHFRPGSDQWIVLPATFGLLLSTDDGASFRWACEESIGYGGTYDPDYTVDADGNIYATTFEGLRVSRDQGCTWENLDGPWGAGRFVAQVEGGADGSLWAAAGELDDNKVYRSLDGASFTATTIDEPTLAWTDLKVDPTDGARAVLVGNSLDPDAVTYHAFYTDDAGQEWTPLVLDGFGYTTGSLLRVAAIGPPATMDGQPPGENGPPVLFLRVEKALDPLGDVVWRSEDLGQSWSKVLEMDDTIRAFVIRGDGQTVVAGTKFSGTRVSSDGGKTFTEATQQPQMGCAGERPADGTLFGCGSNYAPDNFGLATSMTGDTWDGVFVFQDIAGPIECPAGTPQRDTCAAVVWPMLCMQIGACSGEIVDAGAPDAQTEEPPKKGCDGCRAGVDPLGLALALAFVPLSLRRRRR